MKLSYPDLVCIFGSLLLMFLGFVFLVYKQGQRTSNRLLAFFLIANSILFTTPLQWRLPQSDHFFRFIAGILSARSYLLLSPLIFLYTASLCVAGFRLRRNQLLHLLPYVIFSLIIGISFAGVESINENPLFIFLKSDGLFKLGLHIQIPAYLIASGITIRRYQLHRKTSLAPQPKVDVTWIYLILISFFIMWLADLLNFTLSIEKLTGPTTSYLLYCFSVTINILFCLALVYYGIVKSPALTGIAAAAQYGNSALAESDYKELGLFLTKFIHKKRSYLNPELTLDKLAGEMAMAPKKLSQIIHVCFNRNFNDFINSYRVEEAKNIFLGDPLNRKTVLEVLLDSGFNSKSVFNDTFKKFTDTTPTAYRKKAHSPSEN
jgi:AraC-like DNA-binding protein